MPPHEDLAGPSGVRGIPFEQMLAGVLAGDVDELAETLRAGDPGRIAGALRGRDARPVLEALRQGDVTAVAGALLAWDRPAASVPRQVLEPLPAEQARAIARALEGQDVERIARALRDNYRTIWEGIFAAVLPRVVAAAQRRCRAVGRRFEAVGHSLTQSVARTVLRRAKAGKFQAYHLESLDDLAGLFVLIAWRKLRRRLARRQDLRLPPDPDAGGEQPGEARNVPDPARRLARSDPGEVVDPRDGPLREVLAEDLSAQLHREIDSFCESLDPADRVILRSKLGGAGLTHEEIARRVAEECRRNECSTKTVQRRWEKLRRRLRERLAAYHDGGDR